VADDEPLARERLLDLLSEVPWLSCVGALADGPAALAALDQHKPDLLFLDIEMPGLSGLDVLAGARHRPVVVFTTAYDHYAVAAFDLAAADYLLKPFGRSRFLTAVERARTLLERGAAEGPATSVRSHRLGRFFIRDRGRLLALVPAQIERFEADDDYVGLHVEGRRYLVRMRLRELEARLDPRQFVRVHRRHIVNLEQVRAVLPQGGALVVEMRDGTRLRASRRRAGRLRERALD
jgi:two-component system LytT family response regulator